MEKRYGLYSQGSSGWSSMRNEEFHEQDVWKVLNQTKILDSDNSKLLKKTSPVNNKPSNFITKPLPSATKMIPYKSHKTPISQEPHKIIQHSAPVNIPDWSKIYGKKPSTNPRTWLDDTDSDDHDRGFATKSSWESEDEDEDEERNHVIPPHEFIAKKLSRSEISSFSVCEGAGRTLKGRDLSRVRNSVLTRTGFLESS